MTRTIAARYAGRCQTCGQEYAGGDSITKIGYRKWVHSGCYTPTNGEAAIPQAVPAATPSVFPMPTEEITNIVRRLLDGAELSVDESEVRRLVQMELAKNGTVQHFEVHSPAPSGSPPPAATSCWSVRPDAARPTWRRRWPKPWDCLSLASPVRRA
jgi:hypothetical protein